MQKRQNLHFLYSFLPLGLCCICEMKSKWRLEAKATNKNEIKFCLGPFALVLHAYAAAATYAKARLGLGQVTSGGSKCSKSNKNTKCNRGQEECEVKIRTTPIAIVKSKGTK
jgi:hypothetical protein